MTEAGSNRQKKKTGHKKKNSEATVQQLFSPSATGTSKRGVPVSAKIMMELGGGPSQDFQCNEGYLEPNGMSATPNQIILESRSNCQMHAQSTSDFKKSEPFTQLELNEAQNTHFEDFMEFNRPH